MVVIYVTYLVCLLIAYGLLALKKSFNYWQKKGVYTPKPIFPVGNIKNTLSRKCSIGVDLWRAYDHFKTKSLDFGGIYFLNKPVFVPVNLDLIKRILITDFDHFADRTFFSQGYDPLSLNLFALKGSRWKQIRAKLSIAFTASKNRLHFDTILRHIDELEKIVDNAIARREAVDVNGLSARLAIDVISSCAFGFECNSLQNPDSRLSKDIVTLHPSIRGAIIFLLGVAAPKILTFFKIRVFEKDISDFFTDLVKQTLNYRGINKVVRSDFIQHLLQLKNNDGSLEKVREPVETLQLTMGELAGHAMIFFFGGYETVNSTITNCLYELAKNTEIQKKIREEVACLDNQERRLTYDLVQSLEYVEKVVYETMRMYPPLHMHMRECTKDYVVPSTDIVIEKGCFAFIPVLGIQRDPMIYPNPDVFDPERFSPDNIKKRHSCAWSPFGMGPKTCIAYQFGLMEVKATIATLLSQYEISISSKTKQPLEMATAGVVMVPNHEVWLHFKKIC